MSVRGTSFRLQGARLLSPAALPGCCPRLQGARTCGQQDEGAPGPGAYTCCITHDITELETRWPVWTMHRLCGRLQHAHETFGRLGLSLLTAAWARTTRAAACCTAALRAMMSGSEAAVAHPSAAGPPASS